MPAKLPTRGRNPNSNLEWGNLSPADMIALLRASESCGDVLTTHEWLAVAWSTNRDLLLTFRLNETDPIHYCQPGTRPLPWWRFDAEDDLRILGYVDDFNGDERAVIESQEDALRRMGQISDTEDELIRQRKRRLFETFEKHALDLKKRGSVLKSCPCLTCEEWREIEAYADDVVLVSGQPQDGEYISRPWDSADD